MLYVPYSTQLCRKIQARTQEIIKCKDQLARARKWQKVPDLHALNMPKASSQQANSPQ
ncbi:hypothetical protein MtrunA17_Chr4g0017311 [Medicago truncatula]|uniref:Uncharacterized protein n=1 Tax=Medicago truncatula TaxID=3880 RepID=A0A396I4R0_MEDTR|nr:hypothetical protein MtrunA17_Chr4g0017311 [Medicago truncatula]